MSVHRLRALVIGIDEYPFLDPDRRLRGAVADANAIASVMREQSSKLDLTKLLNSRASREAVLGALDDLVAATRSDDEVLVYWSGHGSQVPNQANDDEEEDGWDETLVPYDSGRGRHPNRDILDDEIYTRIKALNKVTDRITFILDSCHSGTAVRTGVRGVPRDGRSAAASGLSSRTEAPSNDKAAPRGSSGWLPAPDADTRYLLLAACRDDQEALELPFRGQMRGAFTWALCRELERTQPGTTWKSVFGVVSKDIAFSTMGAQIPQIEGNADRLALWTH
ncbi:MAG: caspase family protein [Thermoanaerobaculia bacterium]|nr:caspase family protein [Thermoanaerobaculia bacterium]